MPNYVKGFTVNGEDAKYDYNQLGNKPFGYDTTIELLPATEVTTTKYQESDTSAWANLEDVKTPYPGDICVVTFNGTEYEVEAKYNSAENFVYFGDFDYGGDPIFDTLPFFIFFGEPSDFGTQAAGAYTFSIVKKDKTRLPLNSLPPEIDVGYKYATVISVSDVEFSPISDDPVRYNADLMNYRMNFVPGAKYRVTIGEYSVELYSNYTGTLLGDNYYTEYPFCINIGYSTAIIITDELYNEYHPSSVLVEQIVPHPIQISENIKVYHRGLNGEGYLSILEALNEIAIAADIGIEYYANEEQANAMN